MFTRYPTARAVRIEGEPLIHLSMALVTHAADCKGQHQDTTRVVDLGVGTRSVHSINCPECRRKAVEIGFLSADLPA
jgi:hypothetical protein